MASVQLQKISKIYPGGVKAVDAIDLTIADKEFVVLVGPSGCGKTTTLRMIAGLEEISSGVILIGERIVNDVAPGDRDIAMVFQNYALYPHMTVFNNMAFALKMHKVPKAQIQERVRATAKTLDIEHLLDRKPKALSGGQRQRVAVGRAIVREPVAFLFDEPLSNLDAKLRVTTRAELKRLHQRLRTTTVYVTHDQEEAMTLGERIVVMKDGVIQQADSPLKTYNYPVNRFVAGFIGMPPMNFFAGAIKRLDGELIFEEGLAQENKLTLPGGGFTLLMPIHLRERLDRLVGTHVVMGIRPEHFQVGPRPRGSFNESLAASWAPLQVRLNVIEPLGNDMDVYMSTHLHQNFVGRVEAREGLEIDTQATVYVDLRKVHFFEPGAAGSNLIPATELPHALA